MDDCVRYAVAAAEANATVSFSSLSSHAFASVMHAFRTDCEDVVADELMRAANTMENENHVEAASMDVEYPPGSTTAVLSEPALIDVDRGDLVLLDTKLMKAVTGCTRKEQREQREAKAKMRPNAVREASIISLVQQPIDSEAQGLHDPLSRMNNKRQHSAPTISMPHDPDDWRLYFHSIAQPTPTLALLSNFPLDATSPFAFRPFPYSLSKQPKHPATCGYNQAALDACVGQSGCSYPVPPTDSMRTLSLHSSSTLLLC